MSGPGTTRRDVERILQVGQDAAEYRVSEANAAARARERAQGGEAVVRRRLRDVGALATAEIEVMHVGEDGALAVRLPNSRDQGDVRAEAERDRAALRYLIGAQTTSEERDANDAEMRRAVPALLRAVADDLERVLAISVPVVARAVATTAYTDELRGRIVATEARVAEEQSRVTELEERLRSSVREGVAAPELDDELAKAERGLSRAARVARELRRELDDAGAQAVREAAEDAQRELDAHRAAIEALAWPAFGLHEALADLETICAVQRVRASGASADLAAAGRSGVFGASRAWSPLRGNHKRTRAVKAAWRDNVRPPTPKWWQEHDKVCRLGM